MKVNFSKFAILGALIAVSGCASSSREIVPTYVSPLTYDSYSCDQIETEMNRLLTRVGQLGGQLDQKASTDELQTGVGLFLFWPTLVFLDGDGLEASEYARLTGEYEALDQTAIMKGCMSSSPPARTEEVRERLRAEVRAELKAEAAAKADAEQKVFFPSVKAQTLNRNEITIPDDFTSQSNVLLLAFDRNTVSATDVWDAALLPLRQSSEQIQVYSTPVTSNPGALVRSTVNNLYRDLYGDTARRERVVILYVEEDEFLSALKISQADMTAPVVLVVARDGEVIGRVQGPATPRNVAKVTELASSSLPHQR